jgi:hypothetical protein
MPKPKGKRSSSPPKLDGAKLIQAIGLIAGTPRDRRRAQRLARQGRSAELGALIHRRILDLVTAATRAESDLRRQIEHLGSELYDARRHGIRV